MESGIKKCPHCGGEVQEGATFCLHCMEPFVNKKTIEKANARRLDYKKKLISVAAVILLAALIAAAVLLFRPKRTRISESQTGDSSDAVISDAPEKESESDKARENGGNKKSSESADDKKNSSDASSADTKKGSTDKTVIYETTGDADEKTEPAPTAERASSSSATDSGKTDSKTSSVTTSAKTSQTTSPTKKQGATTTAHVHTDSCYKWVVDVPYKAAVYKDEKVIDVPYSAAVYGDVLVEYTDYVCKVTLYPGDYDTLTFASEGEFDEWFASHNGKEDYNKFGGEVRIDGTRVFYTMRRDSSYKAVRTEYGLVSPEQPEVSHIEKVLVSPEQKEQGHYELICGY